MVMPTSTEYKVQGSGGEGEEDKVEGNHWPRKAQNGGRRFETIGTIAKFNYRL